MNVTGDAYLSVAICLHEFLQGGVSLDFEVDHRAILKKNSKMTPNLTAVSDI